jgi:hypothetical protein
VVVVVTLNSHTTWNGIVKISDYTGAQALTCGSPPPVPSGTLVTFQFVNNSPAPVDVIAVRTDTRTPVPARATISLPALVGSTWRISGQQQACVSDFKILAAGRVVIASA